MPDREKVISWVEGLAEDDWRLFHSDSEVQNIAKAVLALLKDDETQLQYRDDHIAMYQAEINRLEVLLKEQEAKTVIKIAKRFNDCDLTGFCPFCSRPLIKDWAEKYCGYCGNPVLWEGR